MLNHSDAPKIQDRRDTIITTKLNTTRTTTTTTNPNINTNTITFTIYYHTYYLLCTESNTRNGWMDGWIPLTYVTSVNRKFAISHFEFQHFLLIAQTLLTCLPAPELCKWVNTSKLPLATVASQSLETEMSNALFCGAIMGM